MNDFQDYGRNALLLETLSFIAKCHDPENFWTLAIGRLKWILDFTRVNVALRNPDTLSYSLHTVFELRPDASAVSQTNLPLSHGILGNMISGNEMWRCFDPRIHPVNSENTLDESFEGGSLLSVLNVSLEANGQTLGVLSLGSTEENAFCHRDIEIAFRFASHAAVTIQNWQHLAKLKEDAELLGFAAEKLKDSHDSLESLVELRTAKLRALSQQLLKTQDQERRKIARDLHDSTGQTLVCLKMEVGRLQNQFPDSTSTFASLAEISNLVDVAIGEIRTTSYLLHPPLLDELGLSSAVHWYVDGFSKRSRIAVKLDFPPVAKRLPTDVEMVFFRAIQESLTNVHRHSGASIVNIELRQTAHAASLKVEDNGHGITADLLNGLRNSKNQSGVGLAGMRERVTDLNGNLEIRSSSKGTALQLSVPLTAVNRPRDTQV